MANFCICFELHQGKKRHCQDFFAALEAFEDRCRFSNGVWFISTDWTAEQVYVYLRPDLDPEDALCVDDLPLNRAGLDGYTKTCGIGLTKHLGPA